MLLGFPRSWGICGEGEVNLYHIHKLFAMEDTLSKCKTSSSFVSKAVDQTVDNGCGSSDHSKGF